VRPRSLLVLLVLALALGAFVWFYERKLPTTAESTSAAKKVLADVKADDVREVRIERGDASLRLLRLGGPSKPFAAKEAVDAAPPQSDAEWRLEAPRRGEPALVGRADRSAVEGLLSSLLALEKARSVAGADRKEFGLAPPVARVTLGTAAGERVLEVGRELPGTEQRAVALPGERAVYATDAGFWRDLAKPPGDWRSKELFPGTQDEVERVTLLQGATRVVLARRGEEPWIEAPIADHADGDRWGDLLSGLGGLQAVAFVDQPPAPLAALGLRPPQATIEVVRKGQAQPFRVELGAVQPPPPGATATPTPAPEPGAPPVADQTVRWARVGDQLVTVRAPQLSEAVARPLADWRSRAWTSFAVYDVDRIEVRDGGGAFVLTRSDADWKRDGVKIFYGTVSDVLAAIADARATHVLDGPTAAGRATGAPATTLRLVAAGGREQTLQLWAAAADGAPARTSGRDAVLLLPTTLPADLTGKLAAVRSAKPMTEASPSPKARH
jgi:hypothetical protein